MRYSFFKNSAKPIILLVSCILIFTLIMKVLNVKYFNNVFIFLVLYTLICISILIISEINKQKRIKNLVQKFYEDLDFSSADQLIDELGYDYKVIIEEVLVNQKKLLSRFQYNRTELINYREVIEKWAHDIKTPLTASSLLLDNNKSKMDDDLYHKLNISNQLIKNKLDTVLYYARANSSKKDYSMVKLNLGEVLEDALSGFYPVIMEKEIRVINEIGDLDVISDYNTLSFILSQLISNSIKYAESEIVFESFYENGVVLRVSNDGQPPSKRDMPFIFEKSYTGSNSNSSDATGIGLYLVKSFADDLGIGVRTSAYINKFIMELNFKDINEF